jgi:hypothetical protein
MKISAISGTILHTQIILPSTVLSPHVLFAAENASNALKPVIHSTHEKSIVSLM